MMTRRVLACSLALYCLLALGCGAEDAESGNGAKAADSQTEYSRAMERKVDDVDTSLKTALVFINKAQNGPSPTATPTPSPRPSAPVNRDPRRQSPQEAEQARTAIPAAIDELRSVGPKLDEIDLALSPLAVTQESRKAIQDVRSAIKDAIGKLGAAENAIRGTVEDSGEPAKVKDILVEAKSIIESRAQQATKRIKIPKDLPEPPSGLFTLLLDWGRTLAIILGSILGLILLLIGLRAAVRFSTARANARIAQKLQPLAAGMQKQQTEFASQISVLTTSQNDLLARLEEVQAELRSVARIAREAATDGAGRRSFTPPQAYTMFEEPLVKDEPAFPISTDDYLSKMHRSSNIVRPDFQNDILVSDPDGKGELVLIRDATIADGLQQLFVVPRATQFQTKQDFYTYYQKYYDCARPSAGDVWIIDPAVVSKVSGGWQLQEKGVLEVR